MAIPTTCIGAYPKPDYVPLRDWFTVDHGMTDAGAQVTHGYSATMAQATAETEALLVRGTRQAIEDQVAAGIDVPTDGEIRRENYIHYHCRHLDGFDFANLTRRSLRDGAYETDLPTIVGPVAPKGGHFLTVDYRVAQGFTSRPVKITVPGPVTIMDTVANRHYCDDRALAFDLAGAINHEVRALAAAGCACIQVDEPLFARKVGAALDYGIECLERCFDGVPDEVTRVVHICCGYPNRLDDRDYHKADQESYFRLARALDAAAIDQVSIEDAHRHNDLTLLDEFRDKTVVLGVVAVARSRVESVEEVAMRLTEALDHIDRSRLVAGPDCGLGLLGLRLARAKLAVLCEAARSV